MAEKSVAKTAVKKSADKKPTAPSLETLRQDLLEAKRSLAAGELINPRVITKTRKDIARALTAKRDAELKQRKESN